ncbi:MAG: hypothetical protein IRZ11_05550 [Clostridia bacterium]|nr:hypothetical protein [Clostridia bacterium]
MSLWDVVFGRDRLKRPKLDALFTLPAAAVGLADGPGWSYAGRGGVCLKRVEGPAFREAVAELDGVAELAVKEFGGALTEADDEYGFRWYIVSDPDLSDLVNGLHAVAQVATERGFDGQLLAAVVRFADETAPGRPAGYLVYNYKRGSFYAFAPRAQKERDHAAELRVQAALEREIPWERDLGRWYPLWDCPV